MRVIVRFEGAAGGPACGVAVGGTGVAVGGTGVEVGGGGVAVGGTAVGSGCVGVADGGAAVADAVGLVAGGVDEDAFAVAGGEPVAPGLGEVVGLADGLGVAVG